MSDQQQQFQIGGSIETAVKGQYTIDLRAALAEAWEKTKPTKGPMTIALVGLVGIALLIYMLLSQLVTAAGYALEEPQVAAVISLLWTVLTAPFVGGIVLMGIRNALGLPCRPNQLFDGLRRAAPLALVALLTSLLTNLVLGISVALLPGVLLQVLPSIYLMVAMSMAMPLVVQKQISPLKAVIVSIRALNYRWFHLFALYLIMGVLFLLALIPFGLGLIWIAPMFYNLKGILYRDIFGIQVDVSQAPSDTKEHSTFSA